MSELRMSGGNWTFRFDEPVYARVTCTVSSFPDAKETKTEVFISDSPQSLIELYFVVAPRRIGESSQPHGPNERTMRIRLSNCEATNGTRLVRFNQKFSQQPWVGMENAGQLGEFTPSVARHPELNKEYFLYYYYREGDPYEVKATLCFLKSPDDFSQVEKVRRTDVRTFKTADE